MNFKKSLFIFRRDLRVTDNTGLIEALKQSEHVIPCFIFDPRQVGDHNEYRSMHAIQFMLEALNALNKDLNNTLLTPHGVAHTVVEELIKKFDIEAVFANKDYTPFSKKRDAAISKVCEQHKIPFLLFADALLNEPEEVRTKSGGHYSVFTAFFKQAVHIPVKKPQKTTLSTLLRVPNITAWKTPPTKILQKLSKSLASTPSDHVLQSLKNFNHYERTRDIPSLPTTHLSVFLKFGVISVRQAHHAIVEKLGRSHPLIRQLYWRDFFTHVADNNPHVFGHAYHEKFDALPWQNDRTSFKHWCTGTTGFPIVDAGMRELNTTGFMHNRVRMIVASFLTKDLHISWQAGERYFAQQLIDYDPSVNNGNWQWVASTGCDAQPYFRIFNPWLQQKKFDPECVYIKQWIPELRELPAKNIHQWATKRPEKHAYPAPIVDHTKESAYTKAIYKKVAAHKK